MTFGQNVGLVDVIAFDFEGIVYRGMHLVAPPRLDLERNDCPIFPLSDQIELACALLCEVAQGKAVRMELLQRLGVRDTALYR